jgi:Mg2+ and Co2+ transporter CorA
MFSTPVLEETLVNLSQNDKALFSRVGRPSKFDYSITFKETQEMQLLRQRLLKTRTIIETNLRTTESLRSIFEKLTPPQCSSLSPSNKASKHQGLISELVNLIHRYKSHRSSILRLLDIADGTMTLLLKILDYRHDENIRTNISSTRDLSAAEQETAVLKFIARQTQQDSRSMKIVTFIALIYLPGTLVASVYSSHIIEENGKGKFGFNPSEQLLSFLVVTALLTVITVSGAVLWDKGCWKRWSSRTRFGMSP